MSVKKLPKVLKCLKDDDRASPSQIASMIGSDKRTVDKILDVASDLSLVACKELEMSGRKYRVCRLTETGKRILKEK